MSGKLFRCSSCPPSNEESGTGDTPQTSAGPPYLRANGLRRKWEVAGARRLREKPSAFVGLDAGTARNAEFEASYRRAVCAAQIRRHGDSSTRASRSSRRVFPAQHGRARSRRDRQRHDAESRASRVAGRRRMQRVASAVGLEPAALRDALRLRPAQRAIRSCACWLRSSRRCTLRCSRQRSRPARGARGKPSDARRAAQAGAGRCSCATWRGRRAPA